MDGLKVPKNAPPSPAPSHHDLQHSLSDLLMHANAAPPYGHDVGHTTHLKYHSDSRRGTPLPQNVPYHGYDPAMPYMSSYSQHVVHPHESSPYGPLPDEPERNVGSVCPSLASDLSIDRPQTYSTPATSPPTPSRPSEAMTTRSGTVVSRTSRPLAPRSTRVEKAASRKKDKKNKKKVIEIDRPLSLIIGELALTIFDIEKFVNRTSKERQEETDKGKSPGKIKRPMNAFMLYRKAYQDSAKLHWKHHNHQVISQVCGDSWNMETEQVRNQFNEWARLERDNHQKAHPGYKFTPTKAAKTSARNSTDRELGVEDSEYDDFDWKTGKNRPGRKMYSNLDADYQPPRSLQYTQSPGYLHTSGLRNQVSQGSHSSPTRFEYATTNKLPPMPYDIHGASGRFIEAPNFRQAHGQHYPSGVEDVIFRKPSLTGLETSGLPYPSQQHPQMHYSAMGSKPYSGQHVLQHPQPTHRDHHLVHHPQQLEHRIDPMLQEGTGGPIFEPSFGGSVFLDGLDMPTWQAQSLPGDLQTEQHYTGVYAGLDETLLQDHQQSQVLRGAANDWHVETLDSGQFDAAWADSTAHTES